MIRSTTNGITETGIILLAAGASSRMGQSKQLLPVHGEPLLLKTVKTAIASGVERIIVVLGDNEAEHRKIISGLAIQIEVNKEWEKGMGSSIKRGLTLLSLDDQLKGVIIMVCDQPLITAEHIRHLVERYTQNHMPIVASGYGQTAGVPVFFSTRFFKELSHLPDHQGAKNLILENREYVSVLDFPDGQIDLDTMEDYNNFNKRITNE